MLRPHQVHATSGTKVDISGEDFRDMRPRRRPGQRRLVRDLAEPEHQPPRHSSSVQVLYRVIVQTGDEVEDWPTVTDAWSMPGRWGTKQVMVERWCGRTPDVG
jgi:hypothetical protein